MATLPGTKLLIIDPVIVAVGGDSNRGSDVRRGLQPLADLAQKYDVALLGISHFNKNMAGSEPLDRVTGSLAFGAVARVVMGTAGPKEPGGERRLVRLKSNVGPDDGGFAFDLMQTPVPGFSGMEAQTVAWSEPLTGSGRELLAEVEGAPPTDEAPPMLAAKDWLSTRLLFGSLTVKQLQTEAHDAGHAWRTIERAKQALGIKPTRTAPDGGWEWELPAAPATSGESEDRQ